MECMRTRGSVVAFHAHSRAILRAAMGLDDGVDTRSIVSPLEVPRSDVRRPLLQRSNKRRALSPPTGLEDALSLLKKDRICAQRLGMESLVMLTDETSSGKDMALYCSQAILAPSNDAIKEGAHDWIVSLIQDRIAPGETVEVLPERFDTSNASVVMEDSTISSAESTLPMLEDAHHGGVLRSLALRTLANALSVMSKYDGDSLRSILSDESCPFVTEGFLVALAEDLQGASRPPAIVTGTRLASPHEAALAAMCIGILCQHSDVASRILVPPKQDKQPVLDALQKAERAGKVSNVMLEREAERAFLTLVGQQAELASK